MVKDLGIANPHSKALRLEASTSIEGYSALRTQLRLITKGHFRTLVEMASLTKNLEGAECLLRYPIRNVRVLLDCATTQLSEAKYGGAEGDCRINHCKREVTTTSSCRSHTQPRLACYQTGLKQMVGFVVSDSHVPFRLEHPVVVIQGIDFLTQALMNNI